MKRFMFAVSLGLLSFIGTDAEAGWVACSKEYEQCKITGTKQILYGQSTTAKYVVKNVTGAFTCNNATFGGDPAVNVAKACWYNDGVVAPTTTTKLTLCSKEYEVCKFTGTKLIKFGTETKAVTKSFTGSVPCTSMSFGGDPAFGLFKSCWVQETVTSGGSSSGGSTTPPVVSNPTSPVTTTPTACANRNPDRRYLPFAATSPWNQPIPANATYLSRADARVSKFQSGPQLNINIDRFSLWLWQSAPTDPLVTVHVSVRNLDSQANNGLPRVGYVQVRLPAGSYPDPGINPAGYGPKWGDDPDNKDAHMVIIDADGKTAHEFWHMEKDKYDGRLKAVAYVRTDLNSEGIFYTGEGVLKRYGVYDNPNVLTYGWGSTRAYGGSSIAGAIRQNELLKGPICHALAITIPQELLGYPAPGQLPLYPASKDDGPAHGYTGNILMGTRFAIPKSVNIYGLGLSTAGINFAKALQDYGAFLVDQSGGINFAADSVAGQPDARALINSGDMAKIKPHITIVQ